jgi:hypothetical protein
MEIVFDNELVSKNQYLRGNALANSLPRNDPHVTLELYLLFCMGVIKERT